jgi:5-methylcytosine-specific restriction endonuclease McrA
MSARPEIPDDVRQAVRMRSRGRCEECGREGLPLEMHHMTYENEWEKPEDLEHLCRDCHLSRHLDANGDFWADPMEKEAYWATYYSELDKDD